MSRTINRLKNYFNSHRTWLLWFFAALFFALSFFQYHAESSVKETKTVQKKLNNRIKILDDYAEKALKTENDEWPEFEFFPEDMVIYKYNADTLQSWVNLFPISNDEVDLVPLWYRIHDMNNRNLYNTPLAYLGDKTQYVNLGSSWYVIKVYREKRTKVIAGILVKTNYLNQNSALLNTFNKKIGLDRHFTTVPVNIDDSHVVFSKEGDPLFSIISNTPLNYERPATGLRWLSILLSILALFSYHSNKRNYKSLAVVAIGLGILRLSTIFLAKSLSLDSELFSPSLYADGDFFNSLGNFLINHLFIFLITLSIFMSRVRVEKDIASSGHTGRAIKKWLTYIIPILILLYIHFSLRSLLLNSNITMELFMIQNLSIYSILAYTAYSLLFIALLLSLQMVFLISEKHKDFSLFSVKNILLYIFAAALYTVVTVSIYGFNIEYEKNKVLTNKLAIERDLSLEFQLRSLEGAIYSDPIIKLLVVLPQGNDLIKNRLEELYLRNIIQKYDIRITICKENDRLSTENYSYLVNCFDFFRNDIIDKYGLQLAPRSSFYYVNNYNSTISYIGVFSFFNNDILHNLYIEIDSKPVNEIIGYPSLLIDDSNINNTRIPNIYSYAKYYENRLSVYKGRYNYPVRFEKEIKDGYSFFNSDGYIHFFNKISKDNYIIISRPKRSIVPYIVSFSYMFLFYSCFILGFSRFRRKKKEALFSLPKNSFRKKITYLVTISMVVTLICMGTGSIVFTIKIINESNMAQMEEKLQSVQSTISEMCKYADQYNEINTLEMFTAMDKVAANTQVDINLYDPHGRLIRSTRPEVFDQYLLSARINNKAYKNLIYLSKKQVINKEKIAGLSYSSLYAPIFNNEGKMVAIANIPYFINNPGVKEDASAIIAAIINLYILLLIASIIGGSFISNSITKPLAEISKKLQEINFSQKAEHINYKGKDELGFLVKAYNKMVDDLDESSKQLAQNEREQAWKEMARQIAHEIKNPLTPMRLSIQHLVRLRKKNIPDWEVKFDAVAVSLLEQIDILSETATEFSSFAKFYNEDDVNIDLVTLLKEQYILFNTRDNIDFTFIHAMNSAWVYAKKSQITRALVNLISNAIQAIEQKKDGILRITLSIEGDFYRLDIEDNGPGVSPDNYIKLFKPNFTTKSGGTGLGLAISKNIVDQSRGNISYEISEFGGANFIIKLPIKEIHK